MWAASKGHTAVVEDLLGRGAQVNCVNKVGQQLLGLQFLLLALCAFLSLGEIRRARGRTAFSPPVLWLLRLLRTGFLDPCHGDTGGHQNDGLLLVPWQGPPKSVVAHCLWTKLPLGSCTFQGVVLDGLICKAYSFFCNLHCCWLIACTKIAASASTRGPQFWTGSERNPRVLLLCPDVLAEPAFWLVQREPNVLWL